MSLDTPLSADDVKAPETVDDHLKLSSPRVAQLYNGVSCISDPGKTSHAFILRPRAGLFEGQLIAFVIPEGCELSSQANYKIEIQHVFGTAELPTIQTAIELPTPADILPSFWVVFKKTPLDASGRADRRKLQTWIQNANEESQRHIISICTNTNPGTIDDQVWNIVSEMLCELVSRSSEKPIAELEGIPVQFSERTSTCHHRKSEEPESIFDLSPMQRLYFHSPLGKTAAGHRARDSKFQFNQSILLQLNKAFDSGTVQAAIRAVLICHPMLRCRFKPTQGGSWCQWIEPEISSSHSFAYFLDCSKDDLEGGIAQAQDAIDIEHGPIFVARHFTTTPGRQMLYLAAHHLVIDVQSWTILVDDIEHVLLNGCPKPSRSVQFPSWVRYQHNYARRLGLGRNNFPVELRVENPGYWGLNPNANLYGNTAACGFVLGGGAMSILEKSGQSLGTDAYDNFLAALLLSFVQTFPDRQVPTVWNQEHERASLDIQHDVSETVGWFTSLCPILTSVLPTDDILSVLYRVQDARQAMVGKVAPFFAASLSDPGDADHFISSHCPLELLCTYFRSSRHVQSQHALLKQIPVPGKTLTSRVSDVGSSVRRIAVFEVLISVNHNGATLAVLYQHQSKHKKLVERWIRLCERLLRQWIQQLPHTHQQPAESPVRPRPMLSPEAQACNKSSERAYLHLPADDAAMPPLGSDASLVEDVAEASSIQTMHIGSGNADYLLITISGTLHRDRLETACLRLVNAHPILRTAFVVHNRHLYQTVLRSFRPEFIHHQRPSWRLDALAKKSVQGDRLRPFDFRQPVTKFWYFYASKHSTLVVRLSKAQYDRDSLSALVRDLVYLYHPSEEIPSRPGLCGVIRASQTMIDPRARDYWRDLLDGAAPTQVIAQPSPASASSRLKRVHQRVATESLLHVTVPFETVLNGVWSMVLSNLSGIKDIVFGQVTDCRHLRLAGGQSLSDVIGPLGNIIPVRTVLPTSPFPPSEYLESIHRQHIASRSHAHMQTAAIVRDCTSWPDWTRFSTVVHHENTIAETPTKFTLGDASCELHCMETQHQDSDIMIRSAIQEPGVVNMSLTCCEKIELAFAERVLAMLCLTVKDLCDNLSVPRIPLPAPATNPNVISLSSVRPVDPEHARAIHNAVSEAWDAVLHQGLQLPELRPYYEIWGDSVAAAELARYYTDHLSGIPGLEQSVFTTEEIISHPIMIQQYELAITKQQQQVALAKLDKKLGANMLTRWGKGTVESATQWSGICRSRK
ncbi:Uu.00g136390.m01.CDS01 [Anthostomella pinea]|uniref:Uu.00g136390.m01.CDS01 n=1 Tax=Anthostomella pinea TaxID=933095 RepID=A0AAI8YL12_9PEZI|nr:Uu.00g136390.m01.CDS01 [Anthostomella pinea]